MDDLKRITQNIDKYKDRIEMYNEQFMKQGSRLGHLNENIINKQSLTQ
jgi:uncharacterized coiled-coil DUF342 family protein